MLNVISSVQNTDKQTICAILNMHVNAETFDLDPCFSVGNFYNKTGIPTPKYKFDINPQIDGVIQADVRNLPIIDKINSVIFDPPFMFGTHGQTKNNVMKKRFSMFDTWCQLESVYVGAIKEFNRILNKGGY